VVLLLVPFWQQNPVIWGSLLVTLIIVPMYAGELIKKLREARDYAERESQAKSELLAKVSHELRTPLTGIISATELLAAEAGQAAVSKRTDTILALSNELLDEINDLLDEAKYGAHALELTYAPIDLNDQIALLRNAMDAMAAKKGLEFWAEMDPAIEDRVENDAHHLGRVLLNLAGNAVKFTDSGSVRLSVELLEQTAAEYRLRFSVTDTGIGIPEEFHAKMFKPFSQVDQGASRRYGGTGLGLTLSKQIVGLMGGELMFESVPGRGSRFWFELMLRRSIQRAAATATIDTIGKAVSVKRILVAEDNETNVLLLQELLEMDGHEVTTCASGMAALELLTVKEFDLLLLDYNLGDMDGVRVLQTYRFGQLHPAPALFLTADATQLTASRLIAAGGAGVLYKPIKLVELRKALAQIDVPVVVAESVSPDPPSAVAKPARPTLVAVPINPLDPDIIEELRAVSTRPEFFPRLLAEAENDIERNCRHIIEALTRRNYASVRDAAHALKGVSANIGAVRLVTLANSLMLASREELDSSRDRWIADVREAQGMTAVALRKLVRETNPSSGVASLRLHLD
jgi:two-component system sensor histidine kinase RpfC